MRRAVGAEAVAVRVEVGFPLRGQHLRDGLLDPGFTKCTQLQMEDFAVTCPLVPNASRPLSGFCSSPRRFGLGFLQTPLATTPLPPSMEGLGVSFNAISTNDCSTAEDVGKQSATVNPVLYDRSRGKRLAT